MNTPNPSALDEILSADDNMQRLNVDLDSKTYAALKAFAKSRGKTISKTVRAMIAIHLSPLPVQGGTHAQD